MLIGGVKPVYGLVAYVCIGLAGLITLLPLRRREMVQPRFWCVPLALALAGYVIVRALVSPVSYLARNDFFMVAGALVIYLVTALSLTRTSRRLAVCWGLFALAVCHVGVGAVQFRQGDNYMLLPWIYRSDYSCRASGFYICPNHLAGLLEMLALMGVALVCWGRGNIWFRLCSGYAVLVCVTGLALTGSRGGILSLAAGGLVFAALSANTLRRLRLARLPRAVMIVSAGLLFLLGSALWLTMKSDALAGRVGQVYDPQNMRLQMWAASLHQFGLNPVFGTGSGTYYYYGRQFRDAVMQNDPLHVHNDYLELLAEYGVVGVLLAAAFFAMHLYSGWRGLRRIIRLKLKPSGFSQSTELALDLGALSALAALLMHSVLDFNLHIPANVFVVAFLLGLVANPAGIVTPTQDREPTPDWLRFIPSSVGAALALLAIILLPAEVEGERARVALRDGQNVEARDFARQALTHEGRNPDLYYYLGEAQHYLALAEPDPRARARMQLEVVKAFEDGLRIFPQDVRLLLKLGRTLDSLGAFADSEEVFQRAFTADPKSSNVYAYYAVHCQLEGQRDLAEQFYSAASYFGEREISPVGLADLARERRVQHTNVLSIMSGFVTPSEEDRVPPEPAPGVPRP